MTSSTTPKQDIQPTVQPQERIQSKRQPLYHVVLIDDNDHSYEYVVGMLRKLFSMTAEDAFLHACRVDTEKRVILATTTLERAELKRDQIQSFGRDWRVPRCCGSMTCQIEPISD
jgi:ATP-dependent Clp protease adaptor protein ClpS